MTVNKAAQSAAGLGNRALLDKMDKLREIGISGMVPLPQVRSMFRGYEVMLTVTKAGCRGRSEHGKVQCLGVPDWLSDAQSRYSLHSTRNRNHLSTRGTREHRHLYSCY